MVDWYPKWGKHWQITIKINQGKTKILANETLVVWRSTATKVLCYMVTQF